MKKAMLFLVAFLFSVSASAATYTITQTAGSPVGGVGNGTSSAQAIFQGDSTFTLDVVSSGDAHTLVNFDFAPEPAFISGTLEIVGVGTFNLVKNFQTIVSLAAGSYTIKFDITPDSTGSQTLSVSEVPVPAAAFLFAPALVGFMALRRKASKAA